LMMTKPFSTERLLLTLRAAIQCILTSPAPVERGGRERGL
jgi:hypothetical protein